MNTVVKWIEDKQHFKLSHVTRALGWHTRDSDPHGRDYNKIMVSQCYTPQSICERKLSK